MNEEFGKELNGLTIERAELAYDAWHNRELHLFMTDGSTVIFHTVGITGEHGNKLGVSFSLIDKVLE